jgi:hypothetical protein
MNETIVDEELIGTQFSLEHEEEAEEKDEVRRFRVADPGCLSRIQIFPSRIPNPPIRIFFIPDAHERI